MTPMTLHLIMSAEDSIEEYDLSTVLAHMRAHPEMVYEAYSSAAQSSQEEFDRLRARGTMQWHIWRYFDVDKVDRLDSDHIHDLNDVIITAQVLCDTAPVPCAPDLLCELGERLIARFELLTNVDDLENAIAAFRRAVEQTLDSDDDMPLLLRHLGTSLSKRFKLLGMREDLESALTILCCEVELWPEFGIEKRNTLYDYAMLLKRRLEYTWDIEDMEHYILALRHALSISPDDDLKAELIRRLDYTDRLEVLDYSADFVFKHASPALTIRVFTDAAQASEDSFGRLRVFGTLLWHCWSYLNIDKEDRQDPEHTRDLDLVIVIAQVLCDAAPIHDDPDLLAELGERLIARFELSGNLEDLDKAIEILLRALRKTLDDDDAMPSHLHQLGVSLSLRFELSLCLKDMEGAVMAFCCEGELRSDDDPEKPEALDKYAMALIGRYIHATHGNPDDLEVAMSAVRRAVDLLPEGDSRRPEYLCHLSLSLLGRFIRHDTVIDLDSAISVQCHAIDTAPDDHIVRSLCFASLGGSLQLRFGRIGGLENIEGAILAYNRGLEAISAGPSIEAGIIASIGNSLLARYNYLGALEDLERAVSAHRKAIELQPEGGIEGDLRLENLCDSLLARFERTGEPEDIVEAISIARHLVDITPDGHPLKPSLYSNLAHCLGQRFAHIHEPSDIDGAILAFQRAIELTLDIDQAKPGYLANFASALLARNRLTGHNVDIETAVSANQLAVELLPKGHPLLPDLLSLLAASLKTRFLQSGGLSDIDAAIEARSHALSLTPDHHSAKPSYYGDLGLDLVLRFDRYGDVHDLHRAILAARNGCELRPKGHFDKLKHFEHLGKCQARLFERTELRKDFDAAVQSFMDAISQPIGFLSSRFDSAAYLALLLSKNPELSSMEAILSAYTCVLDILPQFVWLGQSVNRRFDELEWRSRMVGLAVTAAIDAGSLEHAVEWLEAGRSLVWSQILSLRTPLDELENEHPDLAETLQSSRHQLQYSGESGVGFVQESQQTPRSVIDVAADRNYRLTMEYEKVLSDVREHHGFEDFLRPRRHSALVSGLHLADGPIVIVNTSDRSHALILLSGREIVSVPLPDLSSERIEELLSVWTTVASQRGIVSLGVLNKECNGQLHELLEWIWRKVVEPVLQALDLPSLTHNDPLPHITWCPTGLLARLPLHAAGIYSDPMGPRIYDLVVSSYTPSLSAFQRCCEGLAEKRDTTNLLVLTQPCTPGQQPLPGTKAEGVCVQNILLESQIPCQLLNHEAATVELVKSVVSQYPWVHFACHGVQHAGDPTQSAFVLYDGNLSLSDLMPIASDDAELAFLSACQTATGDEKYVEEAVHLTAGMLAVGFKGVIGTLWSIGDDDAPVVVEAYYKKLLELRRSGAVGKGQTGAAYALHEAVRVLREKVGESDFVRWAPFVHFGV